MSVIKDSTMAQYSILPSEMVYFTEEPHHCLCCITSCPKHLEIVMIINKIFASRWYLSSFSYMLHGHTYIKHVRRNKILLTNNTEIFENLINLILTNSVKLTNMVSVCSKVCYPKNLFYFRHFFTLCYFRYIRYQ